MMRWFIQQVTALWARFILKSEPIKPIFHLEYVFKDDVRRQNLIRATKVKRKQLSKFTFKGESLYREQGQGHSFVWGYFHTYITKSGKVANYYFTRDFWIIENEFYECLDGEFVIIPRREYKTLDLTNPPSIPMIKSLMPELASMKLISVQPMNLPTPHEQ